MHDSPAPTRVFLVCSGLGHVHRGFESFTRECFDALRHDPRLDLRLFQGAGVESDRERTVWCLKRTGLAARILGAVLRDPYYVEQLTFALSLVPHLRRLRPQVVYYSDGAIGNWLWRLRPRLELNFKLLLSNGGPIGPPGFPRINHVHQISPVFYDESAAAGRSPATQTLIPYGFKINRDFLPPSPEEKAALRARLNLPLDRPLVLSVGAINHSHKRMDYLIQETAALPEPRPYLLLLGNRETETPEIESLLRRLLGERNAAIRTVPHDVVSDYYRVADLFVLGSVTEGFPRVFGEALTAGLPCIAHCGAIQRFALGRSGTFVDVQVAGAMSGTILNALQSPYSIDEAASRHRDVYERLSWNKLAPRYVDMILRTALGKQGEL
ncbi:MAG: glycosyltransferase [Planctomycetaceae bacterium]|nr:glycosyltransferase [Planctomycetaceae bacterium]